MAIDDKRAEMADDETRTDDPIRSLATDGVVRDPDANELLKGDLGDSSAEATPSAGRTSVEDAIRQGPLGFLQLLGPGLITGASDDDPSGIGTYSQVGSQYGLGLLWMAPFTFPLMASFQELCARIALQTGVGLGVSLRKKFPTWIIGICLFAMVIANTINLGADLGAVAAGISLLTKGRVASIVFIVPVGLLILGLQLFTSYRVIFKAFKFLTLALFSYVITVFIAHPDLVSTIKATVVPHLELNSGFVTAVVAVLGTTISPYLFIWQASAEVDEMKAAGVTSRSDRRGVNRKELRAARVDIMIGMAFSQIVMYAIILTSATVLNAHGQTNIQSAQDAANALQPLAGPAAFVLFAAGMIGTGLLAIPILSGSAAYAVKEFFGMRGNLAIKPQYRPTFYAVIVAATIIGAVMNFTNLDPIKALFYSAVLNGLVAPPLMFFIVLLGSDRAVMKSKVSGRVSKTLTWIATAAMALAAIALVYTLIFPAA